MHPYHTDSALFVYFLLSSVRLTVANPRPSYSISATRHSTYSTPASQYGTSKPSPSTARITFPASLAQGPPRCRPQRPSSCAARGASACASPRTRPRFLSPCRRCCITLLVGVVKLDISPWRIGTRCFRDFMGCRYRPRSPPCPVSCLLSVFYLLYCHIVYIIHVPPRRLARD
jgi:hypothetical protein